jgi:hypothetical protein
MLKAKIFESKIILKAFGSKKNKGPKQVSQNWRRRIFILIIIT